MMAADTSGDVFFIDGGTGSTHIREYIASNGNIVTPTGLSSLGYANGLAIDSSGNLYISAGTSSGSGSSQNYVYKWTASTDTISTIAGIGTAGYSGNGGLATSAKLSAPQGVAVDSSGDVYVSDTANNVVREISASTGDIAAYAGNGTSGYTGNGGPATSAELDTPLGLALDSSGDLFIADEYNSVTREVNESTGDISTVTGATNPNAQLAVSSSGDLFLDAGSSGVKEVVLSTGATTTLPGISSNPSGVTVDSSGNVYVSTASYNTVVEVSPAPAPINFSPATLTFAQDVLTTSALQIVTVTNTSLSSLTISSDAISSGNVTDFTKSSDTCAGASLASEATCSIAVSFTPTFWGTRWADLTFSDGISSGLNYVYLTATGLGYSSTLAGDLTAGYTGDGGPALSAELKTPTMIVTDSSSDVFFIDGGTNVSSTRIREIVAGTDYIETPTGLSSVPYANGLAIDSSGNLYFSSGSSSGGGASSNYIRKWTASTGSVSTVAGIGTAGYSGNGGLATSAKMSDPQGLVIDSSGNVYFADSANDVVREVNASTGDISNFAGNGTAGYTGDGGAATSAELDVPVGLAIDSSGNLYIADTFNEVVREVNHSTSDISTAVKGTTSTGQMTFDPSGNLYLDDGVAGVQVVNLSTGVVSTLTTASYPLGVAIDPSGNMYVPSQSANQIDEISLFGTAPTGGPISQPQRIGGGGGIAPGVSGCGADYLVDPATGDFCAFASDTSLPTYGPALSFTRTYDATSAQAESATSTPGPLGYGWTDNWATSLALNSDYGTTVSGDITFIQSNGSEALFVPPVSGSCKAAYVGPGTSGTYCALPRVLGSLTYNSGSSTYTLVEHPKTTYTFNSSGQLTSIADPDGASESVSYNSPSPGTGQCPSAAASCETITAASGRTLTLGWSGSGDSGTITSVTDPLGRSTTYAYSSGNLTSVTDPLSNVTSYTYDSSNANANLKHDLLKVIQPNGQSGGPDAGDFLINTYNSSGQVTSQSDPMGRGTSYDYGGINPSILTGTVVVTDPDGNETGYTYNEGALVQKATGYATSSAASTTFSVDASTLLDDSVTDADNHATNYTYDGNGNVLTRTNALSKTWSYSYNSFDEVTCATEPLAASHCSALSPPSAITGGGTITPPSSAPPKYVTYDEYDTAGNLIYQTTGDYAPGSGTASQSRTAYDLYNGESVTLGSSNDSCATSAPSTELACASIDPDAVVTQLAYDSGGDLTSKSTPDGNSGPELATTTYGYDSDGEQTGAVAPKGNLSGANAADYTTTSAYNADGQVTSVTQGGASGHSVVPRTTSYLYDPNGNRTSSTKSTSPKLVGTTSGSNSSSSLALTLPTGTLVGDVVILSTTTSPASGTETVSTPSGYTLVDSVNTGQTTTYAYTHTVGASESGVTLSYSTSDAKVATLAVYSGLHSASPVDVFDDATTNSGTSVAPSAVTTTNPGDQLVVLGGAGQQGSAATWSAPVGLTSEVQAQLSGTSAILADGSGPATAGSTGSQTATTSVSGQLAAVLLALNAGTVTTSTSYDADDEATVVTNPDGNATLTCYDGDGNMAETVPPVGVAANSLSASSCPTTYPSDYGDRLATDATTTAYDAQGEKTTVTTPAPAGLSGYETTTYSYDPAGQLTSVSAPPTSNTGGAPDDVTNYTYDAAGELLTTTTGFGTTAAATTSSCYDPDENMTATVAADGNTSSVASCSTSSPYETSSSYQTGYSYDSLGELITQTAPVTTWASSGQVTTYSYDPVGNRLTAENPDSVTATNTYTPLDQLATVSYSDSTHSVSDTYDADGERTAMTDASGTSSYSYDPFGELTSSENGASKTVAYTYDSLGDTTSMTYPLGAGATWANTDTVTYGYDPASEPTSVTDFNGNTSVITNTADGLPSALALGASGDTVATSYSANDDPASITLGNGSTLQEFAYSDVPSGAIAAEADTPSSALSPADYTYDARGRVTQMTPGSGSPNSYGEDASSNLTTLPTGAVGTYDHASELTSSVHSGTTSTYTYDASGNRTQESVSGTATVSAAYNGATQLTSYDNSAADTTSATYNGDSLRTAATTTPTGGASSTQNFVWDTMPAVPELLMDSNNAYVYGPSGTPYEQVTLSTGTVQYLVSDAIGSVRGVVSSSGALTASTSYDAWGNPETTGGLTTYSPFGFAGAYTDPTGLLYLIDRYYDPTTGQFLTVDPDVAETGQPYDYTGDDPVNDRDPLGLKDCGFNPFCYAGSAYSKTVHWMTSLNQLRNGKNASSGRVSRSEAEYYMERYGVSAKDATEYADSFRGPIRAVSLAPETTVYRYTDNPSSQGHFYSPSQYATSAAAEAGLYLKVYKNNASYEQGWEVDDYPVPALEGGVKHGTGTQYYVLEPTGLGLRYAHQIPSN
jgi:RHS repeat-associated protein